MTLWIVLTLLTSAVAVGLAISLTRKLSGETGDSERELELARSQIAELQREEKDGNLNTDEVEAARLEIERRALRVIKASQADPGKSETGNSNLTVAIVTGWVVAGAVGLYAITGRPDLTAAPFQGQRQAAAAAPLRPAATPSAMSSATPAVPEGSVDDAISALAQRLRDNPDDADGWQMLGWSYYNTQQYDDAVAAYAKAAALRPRDANLLSLYGETIVRAASGRVTDKALAVFEQALASNPADARAHFFKGMALEQAGDPAGALEAWLILLASAEPGDDWAPGVEERVRELAASTGVNVSDRLPDSPLGGGSLLPPPPGPSQEDVAAAQQMTPQDRQAMIRDMVDRLQTRLMDDPADPDGWIRLMRSRLVLGEADAAQEALGQAVAAFDTQPDTKRRILDAAAEMGLRME